MHFCSTVRKTRIVLVRTISLMIVFSVSSGFVRFLLFNFQRASLLSSLPLATAFIYYHAVNFLSTPFFNLFQICFFQCCHLANDLIYFITRLFSCQHFFAIFLFSSFFIFIAIIQLTFFRLSSVKTTIASKQQNCYAGH